MLTKHAIFIILGLYFMAFMYLRCFLYGVKRYQLNNSAYKKRKKGETFKEWLFYSKYKEEIPKILRILYYTVLIIHTACLIACALTYIIKLPSNLCKVLAMFIVHFDVIMVLVLALLFWSPHPECPYERWITKKRGQKRKKR